MPTFSQKTLKNTIEFNINFLADRFPLCEFHIIDSALDFLQISPKLPPVLTYNSPGDFSCFRRTLLCKVIIMSNLRITNITDRYLIAPYNKISGCFRQRFTPEDKTAVLVTRDGKKHCQEFQTYLSRNGDAGISSIKSFIIEIKETVQRKDIISKILWICNMCSTSTKFITWETNPSSISQLTPTNIDKPTFWKTALQNEIFADWQQFIKNIQILSHAAHYFHKFIKSSTETISVLEPMMLLLLFPNVSHLQACGSSVDQSFPVVQFNKVTTTSFYFGNYVLISKSGFNFIGCFPKIEESALMAFIKPFDWSAWLSLGTFIIATSGFMATVSSFLSDGKLRGATASSYERNSLVLYIFHLVRCLLDQNCFPTGCRQSLKFGLCNTVLAFWALLALVVTQYYKGDIIGQMAAPRQGSVQIQYLRELEGYKIVGLEPGPHGKWSDGESPFFDKFVGGFDRYSAYTNFNRYSDFEESVLKEKIQVQRRFHWNAEEMVSEILSCDIRTVWMMLNSKVDKVKSHLEKERKENYSHWIAPGSGKKVIAKGKENYLVIELGWLFSKSGGTKIPFRFKKIVESGIYGMWDQRISSYTNSSIGREKEKPLTFLSSKFISIIYVYLLGVSISISAHVFQTI